MLNSLAVPAVAEQVQTRTEATIYKSPESGVSPSLKQVENALAEIPGAASVVSAEEYDNNRATTIKDILDYTPGVSVQPRNGAEANRLSIRGSGIARAFQGRGVLLLQDGIPINTADGSFDFQTIDPWLYKYTEVFRGANALQFGSSELGGAINFVTPTGYDGKVFGVRSEFGSFGENHNELSSASTSGDFDYSAQITNFNEDGYRDQNEQHSRRLATNVGWKINQNTESRFYINYIDSDAEIPGTLTKSQLYSDPKQANATNVLGDFSRNLNITTVANKTSWNSGVQHIDSTFYYSYRDLDNPATTYIKSGDNEMGFRGSYGLDFGLSKFLIGTNFYYGNVDEDRYANVGGNTGARIVTRDEDAITSEAYIEYDHALSEVLHTITDAQISYAIRNIEQTFPTLDERDYDFFGFNPRIGLRYDYDPNLQFFTNVSQSFEPPSFLELSGGNAPGFNDLKAQTATTAEIGTRIKYQNINFDFAYYNSRLDNELVTYQFGGGPTLTINADKTIHQGVELGTHANLAKGLTISDDTLLFKATYTYSDFRLDDDPQYGNNQLPGAPEHYLRSEILYIHPTGLEFGPNIEWVPESYPIDMANTLYTRPYAIIGFTIGFQPENENYSAYINGSNLFDKDYIASTGVIPNAGGLDRSQFYPGNSRAIYAGLRFSL